MWKTPPCRVAGRIVSPSSVLGDVGAERAELPGQGGQPVGLVAADVRDAAQVRGGVGQRAERGQRGGELTDVVQVGVETPDAAAPRDGQPVVVELDGRAHPGEQVAQRVAGLGGRARPARDGDTPPLVSASIRKGPALERSGSMVTSVACTVPGATRHRFGSLSSTATPCSRSAADGHLDVGQGGHRLALVDHVHTLGVPPARPAAAPRRTGWRPRRRSPPATGVPSRAAHGERQRRRGPRPRSAHPRPRSAPEHLGHRSGAGVRVTVEGDAPRASAATGGTKRITVPARPQSTEVAAAALRRARTSPVRWCRPASPGRSGRPPSARCRVSAALGVRRRDRPRAPPAPGRGWSATSIRAGRRAHGPDHARRARATARQGGDARSRPEAMRPGTWQRAGPRASPGGWHGAPRASLRRRRGGHARRRPADPRCRQPRGPVRRVPRGS